MKKRVVKVLAMMIAIISLLSVSVFISSAENFYDSGFKTTAKTETNGQCIAYFYGSDSYSTTFGISAECRGGSASSFLTYIHVRYYDNQGTTLDEELDSDTANDRRLTAEVSRSTANYYKTGKGFAEFSCVSKTDSSDKWEELYQHQWVGGSIGWRDY